MTQGGLWLTRRVGHRTVVLSMTKLALDNGQEQQCLGVVYDCDGRAAGAGIDGRVHAAVVLL